MGGGSAEDDELDELLAADAVLPGGRFIKISISQVFRITDALVSPEKLRKEARAFHKYLTNHRRTRNSRRPFLIDGLGELKPVGSEPEENSGFWKTAISTSFQKTAPPLLFIPFELSLSGRLNKRKALLESVLDESIGASERFVQNRQVSGRLRIYPTGVGVARVNVALQFREAIHVSAVAQIAHTFEQLLFVDPEGDSQPCEMLLLEVIDSVLSFLFRDRSLLQEARWRPAETIYSVQPYRPAQLEQSLGHLARLLAAAPGNEERRSALETRLRAACRTKYWTMDSVLALAAQRVSLFLLGPAHAAGHEYKRKQLLEWLTETSELMWVAAYAAQAFVEQIDTIASPGVLDDTWLPEGGEKFSYLSVLVENTKVVLQAIDAAHRDVQKLGAGILSRAAADVWRHNSSIDADRLNEALRAISRWLQTSEPATTARLSGDIHAIQQWQLRIGGAVWGPGTETSSR